MPTPDPNAPQSVDELAKVLYQDAYPEKRAEAGWVDEQVSVAVQRIGRAEQADPSTSPGARELSDAVINRAAPKPRKGPRVAAAVVAAVVVLAALVLGITERQWVAETAISGDGILGLSIAAVVAALATSVSYVRVRRRQILSCRVRIDAPFGVDIGETVRLEGEHAAVTDPGVVVVRVKNTGGAVIKAADYVSPLALHFPGRRVISVDATEFEPPVLQRVISKLADFTIDGDRVKLPAVQLEREHSFKLVIVLSGTKAEERHQIAVEGLLRDGRITTREGKEKVGPGTLAWGGLTAICAGALAVVLLLNNVAPFTKLPRGVTCVAGSLSVEGSSAFGRAATELAGSYEAYCPGSVVKVGTPGSVEGLQRLHDGTIDLALSDGKFDEPDFAPFVPQQLAIVPFTLVASKNVPVDDLTAADVRKIFTGGARVWSDITGNPRDTGPIRVAGRSTSSGTRHTLEKYLLGGPQAPSTSDSCRDLRPGVPATSPILCEQGSTGDLIDRIATLGDAIGYADVSDVAQSTAVKKISLDGRDASLGDIRAGYPFWTVEYVFSRGPLPSDSLAAAFRDYLLTPEARNAMVGFQYYACAASEQDLCARR
ncbi:substrate-binding domain-containing protein [Amycolatopsis rhabdoformis]|uniref:Substrate-binding domain-containing protein n=1 Tax=Amycolatopsis rhabdoformis TaxID=1448059 RepID=A0ABZ1HVA7_9PSEU|nr:substrate-binding domain-containing protein [Amycolatopsis rhabdoformis]WSE26030.1 substrate-binding domain-containing protein [Amycolatopsis rhabdoformis]